MAMRRTNLRATCRQDVDPQVFHVATALHIGAKPRLRVLRSNVRDALGVSASYKCHRTAEASGGASKSPSRPRSGWRALEAEVQPEQLPHALGRDAGVLADFGEGQTVDDAQAQHVAAALVGWHVHAASGDGRKGVAVFV